MRTVSSVYFVCSLPATWPLAGPVATIGFLIIPNCLKSFATLNIPSSSPSVLIAINTFYASNSLIGLNPWPPFGEISKESDGSVEPADTVVVILAVA